MESGRSSLPYKNNSQNNNHNHSQSSGGVMPSATPVGAKYQKQKTQQAPSSQSSLFMNIRPVLSPHPRNDSNSVMKDKRTIYKSPSKVAYKSSKANTVTRSSQESAPLDHQSNSSLKQANQFSPSMGKQSQRKVASHQNIYSTTATPSRQPNHGGVSKQLKQTLPQSIHIKQQKTVVGPGVNGGKARGVQRTPSSNLFLSKQKYSAGSNQEPYSTSVNQQQPKQSSPKKRNSVKKNMSGSDQTLALGASSTIQDNTTQQHYSTQPTQTNGDIPNSNNNVFERLYKKQLQNNRVTPSNSSTNNINNESGSGSNMHQGRSNSSQQQWQNADDSSGGMTAHEFWLLNKDQQQKQQKTGGVRSANRSNISNPPSAPGSASATVNRKSNVLTTQGRSQVLTSTQALQASQQLQSQSMIGGTPMRRKRIQNVGSATSSQYQEDLTCLTQEKHQQLTRSSQQQSQQLAQHRSLYDNYAKTINTNSGHSIVAGYQSNNQGTNQQNSNLMLNRRFRSREDIQGTTDQELLNHEEEDDSADLMVVNLTSTCVQQHSNLPSDDRDQHRQQEQEFVEEGTGRGAIGTGTGCKLNADGRAIVEPEIASIALNSTESEPIQSQQLRLQQQQHQLSLNQKNHTKYNLLLNDILVGNFDNQPDQNQQSQQYSMTEEDVQVEEENKSMVFEKSSNISKDKLIQEDDKHKLSRSVSETSPMRRSRKNRKIARIESGTSGNSVTSRERESTHQLQQLQQMNTQVIDVRPESIEYSQDMIQTADIFDQEHEAFKANIEDNNDHDELCENGINSEEKELKPSIYATQQIVSPNTIPVYNSPRRHMINNSDQNSQNTSTATSLLPATSSVSKLPNLLEQVDELADEEANYFSRSPKHERCSVGSESTIVDPQVQLFNSGDGGEEQEDFDEDEDEHPEVQNDEGNHVGNYHHQGSSATEEEQKKVQSTSSQNINQQNNNNNNNNGSISGAGAAAGQGQQSIEQLYGQISMFDQITEENYYGRGEQSDDSQDEGEDATRHIKKFRQQIQNLNTDLHDLIYSGEDEESGADDEIDSLTYQSAKNKKMQMAFKKMGSGKPQNLDLLPSNYIAEAAAQNQNTMLANSDVMGSPAEYEQQLAQVPHQPMMPAHMIKEVVQVLDDDTYIVQESIFNQRYESEDEMMDGSSAENSLDDDQPDPSNEENEDRPEEVVDQQHESQQQLQQLQNDIASAIADAPGDVEEEVEDSDDDNDSSFGNPEPHQIAAPGHADEIIQPLLNQEANLFNDGIGAGYLPPQEGGDFVNDQQMQFQHDLLQPIAIIEADGDAVNLLPQQPCQECQIMQENQIDLRDQLYQAQNSLTVMEDKFVVMSEQMTKLSGATNLIQEELQKRDSVIENYDKEMSLVKAQNEKLMLKLQTIQKIQKGRQSIQKDLQAYQKLVKDQSQCIESLHSTKSEDKKILKQLQRENQRLKDLQQQQPLTQKTHHQAIEKATMRKFTISPAPDQVVSIASRNHNSQQVIGPALSSYQQRTLNDSLMPNRQHGVASETTMPDMSSTMQNNNRNKKNFHAAAASLSLASQQNNVKTDNKNAQQMPQSKIKKSMTTKTMQSMQSQDQSSISSRQAQVQAQIFASTAPRRPQSSTMMVASDNLAAENTQVLGNSVQKASVSNKYVTDY